MSRARSLRSIFAWPLLILVIGLAGLVIALTGDGWRDAASWAALSAPVAAVIWAMRARRC
ncbi:hypothetical protein [Blastomonas sp. SL216]|jgi:hypothetical protein|uniref:hypothetical protein n=1 Tax=Blastomonas sp. SL216 TaxID=2995169 RepID=UPI00237728FC|nr:hypothetical protein OU999_09010 [Blastomonas sp. SL216]